MNMDDSMLESDMRIDLSRQETCKNRKQKSPNSSQIPLTFGITDRRGNGLDEGKDCMGDMPLSLSRTPQFAWVSKASNQKCACFYMAARALGKARHHSNYSSKGDKHCQHSISSCKQIMLRGPDDVCTRNNIIWVQFWRSRCGSSASWGSWEVGRWLLQLNLPDGFYHFLPPPPSPDAINSMLISHFK